MKYIRNLLILAIAIFGFSTVNIQAQQQYYAVGKNVSTAAIERKVRHEILMLPYYGVFDSIGYRLEGSTVILTGKVVQPTTKKDAGRVVKKIEGVSDVVNNIEVLPLSNFDDSIRVSTLRTFARSGGLYRYFQGVNPPIRIIVNNGHLALEGFVATRGDFNYLNVLAHGISGVFSVENNLVIENERP
jgi:hyperosmotically inducible periplasmic protein